MVDQVYHPVLPYGFEVFDNQIAGHRFSESDRSAASILWTRANSQLILKPVQPGRLGECERRFYQNLFSNDVPELEPLRRLVPHFHGLEAFRINGREIKLLKLANVTAQFVKPCIMDVKIGAKTWDPLASPEKIASHRSKQPFTCINKFTVMGFKFFQFGNQACYDKRVTKILDGAGILDSFELFFSSMLNGRTSYTRAVVDNLLKKLSLIEKWFESQRCLHMYGSSILIVVEADDVTLQQLYQQNRMDAAVECKMIDFAHVFDANDDIDVNYLEGIRSLSDYLGQICMR